MQQSAEALSTGFRWDRNWVICKPDGTFLTLRTKPQFTRVFPTLLDGQLKITYEGMEDLVIPLEAPAAGSGENAWRPCQVRVWKDHIQALEVPHGASAWFSTIAGEPCILATVNPHSIRALDQKFVASLPWDDPAALSTHFADGFPYLLVTDKSHQQVLSWQQGASADDYRRWRPNVVVSGCDAAWEEELWREIQVGRDDVRGWIVKQCVRCRATTVNPDKGLLDGDDQPLNTLRQRHSAAYAKEGTAPLFGVNCLMTMTGKNGDEAAIVRVGDAVSVIASIEKEEYPPFAPRDGNP